MRKEDQFPRNEQREPMFSDADYVQDMRVDRLTTQAAIRHELDEINKARDERNKKAAEEAAKEAENARNAEIEQKAQELADKLYSERSAT